MSAPGHCRHCHHLCPGGDEEYVGNGAYVREHCSVDDEAQWSDGHCPACDEASRIADKLLDIGERESVSPMHSMDYSRAIADALRATGVVGR